MTIARTADQPALFTAGSVEQALMLRILPAATRAMVSDGMALEYAVALHPELNLNHRTDVLLGALAGVETRAEDSTRLLLDEVYPTFGMHDLRDDDINVAFVAMGTRISAEFWASRLVDRLGQGAFVVSPDGRSRRHEALLPLGKATALAAYHLGGKQIPRQNAYRNVGLAPVRAVQVLADLMAIVDELDDEVNR